MTTIEDVAVQNVDAIVRRIEAEQRCSATLRKLLAFCESSRCLEEIENEMDSYPEMRTAPFSARTILSWLVEVGGIAYGDAREDGSGTGESADFAFRTTYQGMQALRRLDASSGIERLLEPRTAEADAFSVVLRACMRPRGKDEIGAVLKQHPALERSGSLPSYFIDKLERAGGIEWDRGWKTTREGSAFLRKE